MKDGLAVRDIVAKHALKYKCQCLSNCDYQGYVEETTKENK